MSEVWRRAPLAAAAARLSTINQPAEATGAAAARKTQLIKLVVGGSGRSGRAMAATAAAALVDGRRRGARMDESGRLAWQSSEQTKWRRQDKQIG